MTALRPSSAPAALDEGARIGVIGAGAAGLTVARSLVQKGFRRVTVLEREGRVGGKCWTFVHDGRTYEMGALVLTPGYSHVRALVKELGIEFAADEGSALSRRGLRRSAFLPPLLVDVDGRAPTHVPSILRDEPWGRVAAGCLRLAAEVVRHRSLRAPGLASIPPELAVPFLEWARRANMAEAARLVAEPVFTAFGYGYLEEVPAAYILKYLAILRGPPLSELLDGGFQGLWEAAARGLDVRLNATVRSVRRGEQVVVETDGERFTFDALVLALPLDQALPFLDATAEETELAAKIRYNNLRVVFASATGLPDNRYLVLPRAYRREACGDVVIVHKRWTATDVYGFYAYGREETSLDETVARVVETARKLGGAVTRVHRAHAWPYFPHVSSDDMARGFFDRFDAMQGARRTYHAGELLGLGMVETVVSQARDLVDRHMAIARPGAGAR